VVIRERPGAGTLIEPTPTMVEAAGAAHASGLPRPDELHAIRLFLDRRPELPFETRAAYARRLALAFGRLLGYQLEHVAAAPEAFLQWLVDESVRRHGA
jgi:hypothetical protein